MPGCGLALAGWKPAAAKPRRVEMFAVILECDSTQQPKHWDAKKMSEWLLKHGAASFWAGKCEFADQSDRLGGRFKSGGSTGFCRS